MRLVIRKSFKMKVALLVALSVVLLLGEVSDSRGSPIPAIPGLSDLSQLGQSFGMAKIGNLIKGDSYDGAVDRAMSKLSRKRHHRSAGSDEDSDGSDGGSPFFAFSAKQLEQLISTLQKQSETDNQPQPAAIVPSAVIGNSVD